MSCYYHLGIVVGFWRHFYEASRYFLGYSKELPLLGPMKALFRHATLAYFSIRHATFRQKFAWQQHSKFSPTLDILTTQTKCKMNPYWVFSKRSQAPSGQNENPTWGLDGANKPQGYRMLSRHSRLPFSSRHATLPKIWPWHSTLWPPFMGPITAMNSVTIV